MAEGLTKGDEPCDIASHPVMMLPTSSNASLNRASVIPTAPRAQALSAVARPGPIANPARRLDVSPEGTIVKHENDDSQKLECGRCDQAGAVSRTLANRSGLIWMPR